MMQGGMERVINEKDDGGSDKYWSNKIIAQLMTYIILI
jgi:hypothetical protein